MSGGDSNKFRRRSTDSRRRSSVTIQLGLDEELTEIVTDGDKSDSAEKIRFLERLDPRFDVKEEEEDDHEPVMIVRDQTDLEDGLRGLLEDKTDYKRSAQDGDFIQEGGIIQESGSARRRASHEGSLLQTVLPSSVETNDWHRARSSPSKRRHSQGSALSPIANSILWPGMGGFHSVPGSCETTLTDIMESPAKVSIVTGRSAVPISSPSTQRAKTLSPTSTIPEPFGTPCSASPVRSIALPPLQDEIKKEPLSDSEGSNKLHKGVDGDRANLIEGHTTREGLDADTLMFRDGRRRIDMVLAYEEEALGVMTEAEAKRSEQRRVFQENLMKEGLELELENKCLSFDEKTWFLKIHIPWKTEARYAEVMGMKLPTKRFITISVKAWDKNKGQEKESKFGRIIRKIKALHEWDDSLIPPEPSFYRSTAPGAADREEQFLVKDRHTSYTTAQRSLLVMQILLRAKYDSTEKVGIRRLINDGTYTSFFPLHEGNYNQPGPNNEMYDRRLLYLEWARPNKWYKRQPLWLVRKYFGDKIGLYFCWLGFYTKMLYAPAIVGTLCFFYGVMSMDSDDNMPSKEICDVSGPGKIMLCPMCDKACKYQQLSDSCLFARMTYLFDNPATVFFAIFMSFWATSFLELWKRKQSVIVWEWDMHGIDQDEEPRPEFETSVKTFRINPVTREKEPYMPAWSRGLRFFATGSAVFFMISVVLGAVLGTIIYRLSLVSVIYGVGDKAGGLFIQQHAKIVTSMTAAIINLIIIMILTRIYANLAIYLTNMENPRTQTEYEDSYTFKIFLFEFMNFYSSLIYIAFFKGRFFDYPGDEQARRSEFFRLKGDVCDPAGCLSELCIQLAIIMIGKQFFNNIVEILNPKIWNWWRQRNHNAATKDRERQHQAWEMDYHLQDPGRLALFDEYLEMVLQYGFVTLFVAAFPLAPLFALLNNVAEIRLDAYKMVTQARRPLAERVEDIGAWYGILKGITYAAVVSNAFVIAYTSDYIPRMVYRYVYSSNFTLSGYIDHSLSLFNTSEYKDEWRKSSTLDPPSCQYRGYRNDPTDPVEPYGLSPHYWHVFAARLAFVVVFEHIVFGLTGLMQYIIPGLPAELKTQMQREALLAKEAKYEHGLSKERDSDYERIINHIRQPPPAGGGAAGSWARRLSRVSDGLDAHVTVSQRPPRPSLASVATSVRQNAHL